MTLPIQVNLLPPNNIREKEGWEICYENFLAMK